MYPSLFSPGKINSWLKVLTPAITLVLFTFVSDWASFGMPSNQANLRKTPRKPLPINAVLTENTVKASEEEQFQSLMSEGLAAFHNNNYQLARTRLLQAKSLRPESPEVSEALSQVEQSIALAHIDELRLEALAAEQSEDWGKAFKLYQEALNIDKTLLFAIQGKKQAALATRIHSFLSNPQDIVSDSQLSEATLLIKEAKDVLPQTPSLATKIKELEKLVNMAKTPVKVTIESDKLTEITVYKVGELGRFSERELLLRPGSYTVVGARDGYKDFRSEIIVKTGEQPMRVTVKCESPF